MVAVGIHYISCDSSIDLLDEEYKVRTDDLLIITILVDDSEGVLTSSGWVSVPYNRIGTSEFNIQDFFRL